MLPITRFVAALSSFLAMLALMPKELQEQIPQLFPEPVRGKIGIALALLAFIARYTTARADTKIK
jgi:hypothetical protein